MKERFAKLKDSVKNFLKKFRFGKKKYNNIIEKLGPNKK